MFTKRVALAAAGGLVLTTMLAGPVSAAKPTMPPPALPVERPLTLEEVAAGERKLAASDAYLASIASEGSDLASLSCVTPTGTGPQAVTQACTVPQAYLSVSARDQTKSFYCGPATGQVIASQAGRFAGWSPDGEWSYVARGEGLFAYRDGDAEGRRVSAIGVPVVTTAP